MYLILVYDISVERVSKVLKVCRKYLTWVQNSVFEGEISESDLIKLRDELEQIIESSDSVTIYMLRTTTYMEKEHLGQ
ncbi:MAG: CRISPR-associated endonuclease Cas2 [Nitrososphaeria archaeon]